MNFIDQVLSMENNGRLISQISAPLVAIVEIKKKTKKKHLAATRLKNHPFKRCL